MSLQDYIHAILAALALILPPGHWLFSALEDARRHWLLAGSAAALVYLSTWITLFVPYWTMQRLIRRRVSTAVVYTIIFLALLLSVSAALLSHWWLDYLGYLWQLPLSPPLELH